MTMEQGIPDIMATPAATTDAQRLMSQQPLGAAAATPTPTVPGTADSSGAAADFTARMNALIAASGGRIRIVSHTRSHAQQQALWNDALKKYGSPEAARKWVAPPGHSNHERGLAVDLGGDIALAHKLAPQFGLEFPMAWEDWHAEPAGLRHQSPNAYTTPPPGYPSPTDPNAPQSMTQRLATLAHALRLNPEDQQAVRDQPATAAPVTAPTAPAPAATTPSTPIGGPASTNPMATPSASLEAEKLMSQQAISPSADEVNATAGQTGVQGNPSGTGHIASTPDRLNFAHAILSKLGMPLTPENERVMLAWQQGEGTAAAFNPLATTDHAPGSTSFNDNNGTPVQNFTSFEQGVDTTVKTLTNGRYGNILAALQQGNSAVAVAQAIANSPWGTGALVLRILQGG